MTAPLDTPCQPWCTWTDVGLYCTPPTTGPTTNPTVQAAILASATRTLWTRSCKQYGTCQIVRARVTACCDHAYYRRDWVQQSDYGVGSGILYRPDACGCGNYPYIDLGTDPVASVDAVWIDGTQLDPSTYRVDDWRRLVRTDGNVWPVDTGLGLAVGAVGTLEVSWTYGIPVPAEGVMMAALLACNLAKNIADQCGQVPSGTTSIAREGVTININPPEGDTGVPMVESWLAQFECAKSGIFDPGRHPKIHRIST